MKFNKRFQAIAVLVFIQLLSIQTTSASDQNENLVNKSSLPSGYSKYIVFIGDGEYDSIDGSIMTGGIANANEAGLNFQRKIMKRSDAEIETHKQNALAFFLNRFGINGVNDPDILFTAYEVNPENQIRAVTLSNEHVPEQGWTVHDGGFMAMVVNPAGITLGGKFSGIHVPANTSLVFGEYKILKKNHGEQMLDPMVIRYRSREPLSFTEFGSVVRCELDNDDFGPGFNGGMFGPVIQENGLLQPNIKSVLTFPPLGPNNQHNQDRF